MTTVLCTLYNSLYLDKGMVLYDSIKACSNNFKLYVLCMDEKCYEVLRGLGLPYQYPIRLEDVEDDELLQAKSSRSFSEYCWTCTPVIIKYIIEHFRESICTYIDADMFFYSDPQKLINEMLDNGKSVQIVPHRFPRRYEYLTSTVGRYCVEFNTFKADESGLAVLEKWRQQCIACCSNIGDGVHWGDQKYLDDWEHLACVDICSNPGAGVAPWNISLYGRGNGDELIFDGGRVNLCFYHFQGLSYLSRRYVSIGIKASNDLDRRLIRRIYLPYLRALQDRRDYLKSRFGIDCRIIAHPSETIRWKRFKETPLGQMLRYFSYRIRMRAIVLRVL